MRPNRPTRRVSRTGTRPTYARNYTRASRPRRSSLPKVQLQAPSISLPTPNAAWIKPAAIVTLLLALFVGIANLTALKTIQVKNTKNVPAASVQQLAKDGLTHQWFGRNLFLVNRGALADYVISQEPAIKEANIKRTGFHTLTITVTERQPSLNWKSGDATYLLDGDGTVIGPTQGEYAKLPTVIDSSNLPVKEGTRVVPTSFISFSTAVAALLPGVGYPVTSMTVPASTSELYVQTGTLQLKFDTTRPAGEEITDLQEVTTELKKAGKAPTQYIDLRIEHKAYYK